MEKNKFCERSNLSNEASVEQFFVNRLLEDLGYSNGQVKPKTSLDDLKVSLGSKKIHYKPDYALTINKRVRWILDAKAPTEPLTGHVEQCSGYCLSLNRQYPDENPVGYFLLTNGIRTQLFQWDQGDPVLELDFDDFVDGGAAYQQLRDVLAPSRFSNSKATHYDGPTHTLKKKSISEINAEFAWCHQFIYRKDNLSQSAAFMEFVKLIFLKLLSDKDVHAKHPEFDAAGKISVPAADIRFSKRWIEDREGDHPNPMDALQFQNLLSRLEADIQSGDRKRIFDREAHINLSPETIKGVVEQLENTDLYSIDADLNGRLFETFLNATMRGKDLGQFFTPRSIVKLATRMARLQVTREHADKVIDACCGSGGFLIEVLATMWASIDENKSLSASEKKDLRTKVAQQCIYGIEIARDPALARIARMNMHLHGDGGTSIYQADALDKMVSSSPTDSPEIKKELTELRGAFQNGNVFDVVLTNPPFAKEYQRKYEKENALLDKYETAFKTSGGQSAPRKRLKSSVMFLERYRDLLKPGGRLVTIVDDSILGNRNYKDIRKFIRENFIIRAIISLPGDAFQRSRARVKTSILVAEKKADPADEQPAAFMYYCEYVGVDDSQRERTLPQDIIHREKAQEEILEAVGLYEAFLQGKPEADEWSVPGKKLKGRLDVKSCLMDPYRNVDEWESAGQGVVSLDEWLEIRYPTDDEKHRDLLPTEDNDEIITLLRVRYDGFAELGDEMRASDSSYPEFFEVHTGDIVISNINAVNGAIAVLPERLDGVYVTTEYTVCRAKSDVDPHLVWAMLRSPEARSNMLIMSTGIGRSRVKPEDVMSLKLPKPAAKRAKETADQLKKAEKLELEAQKIRDNATSSLQHELGIENEHAHSILSAFKPPR